MTSPYNISRTVTTGVTSCSVSEIFVSGNVSQSPDYQGFKNFMAYNGTVSKQSACGYTKNSNDIGPNLSAFFIETFGGQGDGGGDPGSPGGTPNGGNSGSQGNNGTITYTIPFWCTKMAVLLIGGGGGGGGGGQTSQSYNTGGTGGGGGGGGFSYKVYESTGSYPFTPGETTITIIAGGGGGGGQGGFRDGGHWAGSAGSNGIESSFTFENHGTVLYANGGYNGTGGAGEPGGGNTNNGTQGAGGNGYPYNGQPPQDTQYITTGGDSGYTTNNGMYPSDISSAYGHGGKGGDGHGPGGGSSASPGGNGGYARVYFFL
uniref:Glycine-rich domain-containing protein n=1 Tax=viral metagenome TaxID=1070528 RepID=A0A6C0AZZ9_9ZZZZ